MRNRSLWLVSWARILCLLAIGTGPALGQSSPTNVVVIISDDQAWTDYGFMGHSHIQTPHLDRLAQESLTFTRGYVPTSLCRPSLASIITGLYPHQHQLAGNDPSPVRDAETNPARRNAARRAELIDHIDRVPTLPRLLSEKGYVSFQAGKWWEGNYRRGGFTEGMTRGFPEPGGRHGDDGLVIGREGLEPIYNFIRRAQENDQPFFVWYAPFLPHTPHTPPARLLDKYTPLTDSLPIAKYWAMCEWFDETCGQLLAFLDEQQLRDNTLIVYVTDNGWINLPDQSAFAPRSKRSPYDGGIRTPIMIRLPGRLTPERDEIHLASSLDLAPTILRVCGLSPTPEMAGIDLLNRDQRERRRQLYGAIFDHDQVDAQNPAASLQYRWTIRDEWKLIAPFPPRLPDEVPQLYQLLQDPWEQENLATPKIDVVRSLQADLDRWWNPSL